MNRKNCHFLALHAMQTIRALALSITWTLHLLPLECLAMLKTSFSFILLSVCLLGTGQSGLVQASDLKVQDSDLEALTPQGFVKDPKQIHVRFKKDIVPFGDPQVAKNSPFDVTCPVAGTGRWLDGKEWVYDFKADVESGTQCTLKLKNGSKIYSFHTGGPNIVSLFPGWQAEEDQVFAVKLDGVADLASVEKLAHFRVENNPSPIQIRLIDGADREKILKALPRYEIDKAHPERVVVFSPKRTFPSGAKIQFVWPKGILSGAKGAQNVATEADQIKSLEVASPFHAEFHCERSNSEDECIPFQSFGLSFNASFSPKLLAKFSMKDAQGKVYRPVMPKKETEESDEQSEEDGGVRSVTFAGPFPASMTFDITIPSSLKDIRGRALTNQNSFPLTVKTAETPPLAKFTSSFGILELQASPTVPLAVRSIEPQIEGRIKKVDPKMGLLNLEASGSKLDADRPIEIINWYHRVLEADREKSIFLKAPEIKNKTKLSFDLPKVTTGSDIQLIGLPIKEPGVYVLEVESKKLGAALLGKAEPMYVPTMVLVTDLAAHIKQGDENSAVWVTSLHDGKPVGSADIEIYSCRGVLLDSGSTDKNGYFESKKLGSANAGAGTCNNLVDHDLYVVARKGKDLTFTLSGWKEGIEAWRYQIPTDYNATGTLHAHSILDRSLLKPGETVSMKHLIRHRVGTGFVQAKDTELPKFVVFYHAGSDERFQFPLKWQKGSDGGCWSESNWKIPAQAKLGTYSIYLNSEVIAAKQEDDTHEGAGSGEEGEGGEDGGSRYRVSGLESGEFRVEQFRIPLMKAAIQAPEKIPVAPKQVPLTLSAQYLAGGGAGDLPVVLRTTVEKGGWFSFQDKFEDFTFATAPVKEGTTRYGQQDEESDGESSGETKAKITSQNLVLDSSGILATTVQNIPTSAVPTELHAELEYRDPSGEIQTVSRRVRLTPSEVLVGIKTSSWMAKEKSGIKFTAAASSPTGEPLKGVEISVDAFRSKNISHRRKVVGGLYSYEHAREIKKVASWCHGTTNEKGLLECEVKSDLSGEFLLQASAKDSNSRPSYATTSLWIAGDQAWWFKPEDHDRIDLLPEKKSYGPNDTARFQVRMPFPEATALVTVEREGILAHFVTQLSAKNPVIEVPLKGSYSPNVYVSALVVRGRTGDVQPTGMVDLGRPAYKLGIAAINVGWDAHKLKVEVKPEHDVYKVREKAKVDFVVKGPDGKGLGDAGVTVAVVDEGLLELKDNTTWNLLESMMQERSLSVATSTSQMQVIGKRHFGLKAEPSGGGGGRSTARELFDSLVYWKSDVRTDSSGRVHVEFPMNDSLTSFRVVAVAHHGDNLFGSGFSKIRSTQDLMIFSGLAQVAREGDEFQASYTLRNASDHPIKVDLDLKLGAASLGKRAVELAVNQSRVESWTVKVPVSPQGEPAPLAFDLIAEQNGRQLDRIKNLIKVQVAVPVHVEQATIAQIGASVGRSVWTMPVQAPANALPGRGGLQIITEPTLVGSLASIHEYMKDYPYSCLEQQTSRAVALDDKKSWDAIRDNMSVYLDSAGFLKYFPTSRWGSVALTAYVLSVSHENGWTLSDTVHARVVTALSQFVLGTVSEESFLSYNDLTLRKLMALDALSGWKEATPAMLTTFVVEPQRWPTIAVVEWLNIVTRMSDLPGRDAKLAEARQILRSRLSYQGTIAGFSSPVGEDLWWLMSDADASIIRYVLASIPDSESKPEMPKLIRGMIERRRRGHYDLTTSNAWAAVTIRKYAKAFESQKITGITKAEVGGAKLSRSWDKSTARESQQLPWPTSKTPTDLRIEHQGGGAPYVFVQSRVAVPLTKALEAGYTVQKTIAPVLQKLKNKWSAGDIARVTIKVHSTADRSWVVVDDPIPAGSTILGGGLGGGDSELAQRSGKSTKASADAEWDPWQWFSWPAFEERRNDVYRAYYEYFTQGDHSLTYSLRLNQVGKFQIPTTRVEAMYAPEMFAESPNAEWTVVGP